MAPATVPNVLSQRFPSISALGFVALAVCGCGSEAPKIDAPGIGSGRSATLIGEGEDRAVEVRFGSGDQTAEVKVVLASSDRAVTIEAAEGGSGCLRLRGSHVLDMSRDLERRPLPRRLDGEVTLVLEARREGSCGDGGAQTQSIRLTLLHRKERVTETVSLLHPIVVGRSR